LPPQVPIYRTFMPAKSDEQLVRESWTAATNAFTFQQVGDLFYLTLFEQNPSLPSTIFKGVNVREQGLKLIQMIDGAVKILDRPAELVPVLVALGERHCLYGTEVAHFAPVGTALITTLKKGLGNAFTADTQQAWVNVYGVIQGAMTTGMTNATGKANAAKYAAKHPKTDEQRVRESWSAATSAFTLQQVGDLFYQTLFEQNPSLPETLFKGVNVREQGLKLIQMIDGAVKILDRPAELVPVLVALGERHCLYGTEVAHFAPVGTALITTLKKGLGNAFTPEVQQSWVNVYGVIQGAMTTGMTNATGKANAAKYAAKHRTATAETSSNLTWIVGAVAAAAIGFVVFRQFSGKH